MPTVLITGASRGIGLEFAKQYALDGWTVFACCRNPESAESLQKLALDFFPMQLFKLDVTSQEEIIALAKKLDGEPIDVLINNAGIFGGKQKIGNISLKLMHDVFLTNTFSPLKVIEAFIHNLERGEYKTIVTISSIRGSISKNDSTNSYTYNASKAAVNMIMKCVALDLKEKGFTVLTLDPGWVKTDMGGPEAPLHAKASVLEMRKLIAKNTGSVGSFLSLKGEEIPW